MKGKYKVNYYELIYKIIIIFSLSMLIVKSIIDIIGFKINIYETLSDYINISIIYNVFQIICYFFLTIEYRKKGFKSSISICLLQFTIGLFIDRNTNIITKLIILCGIFIILSITYYYICKSYKRERENYIIWHLLIH